MVLCQKLQQNKTRKKAAKKIRKKQIFKLFFFFNILSQEKIIVLNIFYLYNFYFQPVFSLDARIFFRDPSGHDPNYLAYVSPLWWQVWASVAAVVAIMPLAIYAAAQLPPKVWNTL